MTRAAAIAVLAAAGLLGCDRNLEPFDASEQPREPDLSKIFPEGAERAAQVGPGLPAPPGEPPGRGAPPLAAETGRDAGPPITGTVSLADGLAVPGGAVLFIIARRGDAGPPLAVKRIAAPRFPLDFTLGPEDRMIQALPFAGPLAISARLDADGNATTREPGDLQGSAPGSVEPGASGIAVRIDEMLPEP
jgi:cytochrome c-type biogenesis protein CcmH